MANVSDRTTPPTATTTTRIVVIMRGPVRTAYSGQPAKAGLARVGEFPEHHALPEHRGLSGGRAAASASPRLLDRLTPSVARATQPSAAGRRSGRSSPA